MRTADTSQGRTASRYGFLLIAWSLLVIGSLLWNMHMETRNTLAVATAAATANIDKDFAFRKWATSHGGVYVPPTEHTPPNPYLNLPDRDVVTSKGKHLTLMNPAYMLREIQTDFSDEYGVTSHITSLKLLNPKNAPDAWEAEVLRAFDKGETERMELQLIESRPYLRLMRPLSVEKGCLKCHGFQGYKVGEVRGGVSTSVYMAPYLARERELKITLALSHGTIWLMGLAGLGFSWRRERNQAAVRGAAAQALIESEQKYQLVADYTADWEYWIGLNGEIIYMSPSCEAVTGQRVDEFVADPQLLTTLVHPDDRTAFQAHSQAHSEQAAQGNIEFRIVRKDGDLRWISHYCQPVFDQQGNSRGIRVSNRDITGKKRLEEELHQANVYNRSLIEASLDPLVTISPEGKITDVNHATEVATGRSRAELIGTDFSDCFAEPEKARKGYQEAFLKGFVSDYPLLLRHRDGRTSNMLYNASVYKNEQGEVMGVFAAARDITEHRRAELARSQLAAIVESSNDAIIGKTLDGTITSWNRGAENVYGYSAAEIVGGHVTALAPPALHAEIRDLLEIVRKGGTVENHETVRVRKDGTTINVALTLSPIRDASGNISGISTIARDITGRMQAGERLRRSESGLAEAQRIAHLGNWELDLEHNVLTWSDEIYRIFEIDPEKFGASYESFLNAVHPDDREMVNQVYTDSLKSKAPYDIVHRLRMKDGRIKYVNEKCETHYGADGAPLRSVGTVHDITERKLDEKALLRLNRELRAISNCNQILMRADDEQSLLDDLCRIVCEDAGYRMAWVGYAENDPAKSIRPVAWAGVEEGYLSQAGITWEDTERGRGPSGTAIRSGQSACCQDFSSDPNMTPWRDAALQRGYRSSISLPLKDESANTFGIFSIYSAESDAFTPQEIRLLEELAGDMAFGIMVLRARIERKQAEDALRRLTLLQRTILDNVASGIISTTPEGIVSSFNSAAERLLGYTVDEVVGKQTPALWHDAEEIARHATQLSEQLGETIPPGFDVFAARPQRNLPEEGEWTFIRKDGARIPVNLSVTALRDESGHITGFVGLTYDLAEHKQVEAERQTNLHFFESMDKVNRAIQGAHDLDQMMNDVLTIVLSIFDCDRTWLFYPCDPDSPTFRVPMEIAKPDYPGAGILNVDVPMPQDMIQNLREALESADPMTYVVGTKNPINKLSAEQFGVKSMMLSALYPKTGMPWAFGLHQCSHPRIWLQQEMRLFREIGRRLADGLSSLLSHRELQESEQRYRLVFENSPVSIWEEDFSGVKALLDGLKQEGVTDIEAYSNLHPEIIRQCAQLAKVVDVNRAALALHGAANKEALLAGMINTFTTESFEVLREEMVSLWNGTNQMMQDAVVRTLAGELRYVTVYFTVCPGYENTLGKVIVSLVDITERKLAEETLYHEQALLNRIMVTSPVGIAVVSRGGQITFANSQAEKILGLSKEEIIQRSYNAPEWHATAIDGGYFSDEEQPFSRVMAARRPVFDVQHAIEWPDGRRVLLSINGAPIFDALGEIEAVAFAIEDITERKLAEDQLRRSEFGLNEAQRLAHVGNWHMDLATNEVFWSEELYKMYGFDPALPPPLYTESMKLFTPESWQSLSTAIARAVETGISYELELELVNKEGRRGWMLARGELVRDAKGAPVMVRGVVMDITERKHVEDALLFVAQRGWQASAENFFDALAQFLGKELDMDYVLIDRIDENPEIAETVALYSKGAITPNMRYTLKGTPCENVMGKQLCIYRQGVQQLFPEDSLLPGMGAESYIGIPLWDSTGRAIGLIAVMGTKPLADDAPVTQLLQLVATRAAAEMERKRAEEEIRKLNQELEQRVANRTAQLEAANKELEAFSYSVSHDLRTPLRAIDGFSHILIDDYADKLDQEGKRLLNVVRDNTRRMGQLIDDILRFSRTGRVELTRSTIDMTQMAHAVMDELQSSITANKPRVVIEAIPSAQGDSAMMRQVFANLLSNAIKFSRNKESPEIRVGATVKDGETVYHVADNGVGFDMQYADKLFGVFQRLHSINEFEGTGIGLAIVKRIVTRHGGRVWAEGKVNEGATLYFALPNQENGHA